MQENFSLNQLFRKLKSDKFILSCKLPLGYAAGIPLLKIIGDKLYMIVPFWKCHITGEKNKNLVFPIRYSVMFSLPELKPVKFVDLSIEEAFQDVNFEEPVGYFPHTAVEGLSRKDYMSKKEELFNCFDKVISALLYDMPYSEQEDLEFAELLNILVEPSLKNAYRWLEPDFYNKYLDA